jgi:hypothetical protein
MFPGGACAAEEEEVVWAAAVVLGAELGGLVRGRGARGRGRESGHEAKVEGKEERDDVIADEEACEEVARRNLAAVPRL